MKNLRFLVMLLSLLLFTLSVKTQAQDLIFEAEDLSLVEKMYPPEVSMWPVIGGRLYIAPNWERMPLRYTLKASPNTVYNVIFFTSDNDPLTGNLDISWDNGKTWDASYRNIGGEKTVKEKVTTDSSGVLSFIIAHTVGINSSLDYIKLVDLSTSQTTVSESLTSWVSERPQPSAKEVLERLSKNPDSLRVLWRPKGEHALAGQTAEWKLDADKGILNAEVKGDKLFSVLVSATDYEGAVRLTVTATAQKEKESPYELMVVASFNPGKWQRQFYPKLPYLILEPDRRTAISFLVDAEDETVPGSSATAFYPFGVLENKQGLLFWGAMDVGKFRVLTPNMIPNTIPSFGYTPLSLQKGRALTFDITLKWFPKPEFKYRDVLRWYLCSMENSDPLTKDWVRKWDGNSYARPLSEGNLGASGTPGGMYGEASEKEYARLKVGNIWFMYFRPSNAPCTTEKTWKTQWGRDASREDMLAQICWLKARGIHPFLYQNQFLGSEEDFSNNPSLREWIGYDKYGKPPLYPFDHKRYYFADFGNDEYRNWYVKKVKECVDFYKPDGLAWDMGFPNTHCSYSRSNPDTSISHGILRVQAELWKWIHQNYPDMRVITNETVGTLSQLVSDAVLVENSYGGGKGKLDYEAAKALGTTLIAGEYPSETEFLFKGIPIATYPYLVMRYRAEGLNTQGQDAVVTAGLPSEPAVGPVIKGSDLQADGQWHIVVVDLKEKLPALNEVRSLAIRVSSAQVEEASLQIEFIRFSQDTTDAKARDIRDKTNPPPYQSFFPVELDAGHFDFWVPSPTSIWPTQAAASDYSVQIKDSTTEFRVRGADQKMEWITLPQKFTANLMRLMSYGGCFAFGAVSEYWPEMNEFNAKAMAVPLAVGSHDIEIKTASAKDENAVTVSAWAGGGRLMLAAYNDGEEETRSTITVVPDVLQRAGIRQIKSLTIRILGRNGRPLFGRSADVSLEEKTGLHVQVQLGTGEALLFQMSDNKDGKGGD